MKSPADRQQTELDRQITEKVGSGAKLQGMLDDFQKHNVNTQARKRDVTKERTPNKDLQQYTFREKRDHSYLPRQPTTLREDVTPACLTGGVRHLDCSDVLMTGHGLKKQHRILAKLDRLQGDPKATHSSNVV